MAYLDDTEEDRVKRERDITLLKELAEKAPEPGRVVTLRHNILAELIRDIPHGVTVTIKIEKPEANR